MSIAKTVHLTVAKSVFFFMAGVILASLFVWSMVQGHIMHTKGLNDAFAYYFVGWFSGVAALALYWQAKNLYHYAEISR